MQYVIFASYFRRNVLLSITIYEISLWNKTKLHFPRFSSHSMNIYYFRSRFSFLHWYVYRYKCKIEGRPQPPLMYSLNRVVIYPCMNKFSLICSLFCVFLFNWIKTLDCVGTSFPLTPISKWNCTRIAVQYIFAWNLFL